MDFREIEEKIEDFGKSDMLYWSTAIAGEVGELCNLVKKNARGDLKNGTDFLRFRSEIKKELADIFIYLVLNARYHKIDLELAILDKIKIVKKRLENNNREL